MNPGEIVGTINNLKTQITQLLTDPNQPQGDRDYLEVYSKQLEDVANDYARSLGDVQKEYENKLKSLSDTINRQIQKMITPK